MPVPSSLVGCRSEKATTEVTPRWSMAYAAALDDSTPCYFDTRVKVSFVAHPMFPVCFEWPVIVGMRDQMERAGLKLSEAMRGVHASHDLVIHRAIHPPERLTTIAEIVSAERRSPGAFLVTRLDTVDESSAPVCSSWYGSLYRGVDLSGPDCSLSAAPALPSSKTSPPSRSTSVVHVSAGLAHVYTECAQIFNPIHTDASVAEAAGLPAIILHGTATLALAVSRIVASEAGGDPRRVARVAGQFRAMVPMPSDIAVRIDARDRSGDGEAIFFDVLNDRAAPAISNGAIVLR
ncbi:MAG: MaoC/PaaZ C-terminal domain-containing protein [Candidatus Binatus sp.]|uniref:MaoC/PaaZ C-terminal domain-containing protein n=1 Tax=Candidatus Binatus sp. TaxID=2811406 RepID=UPI002722474C|nr:MaoC/PaaZ C-terminal domain-containing protein [Candidatus Binatus sp.]MDO8434253.1 MaoC/PaaZ C-terminal domain-containing protein [Candidatus Binatus sp.]